MSSQSNTTDVLGATFEALNDKDRAKLQLEYGIEIKSITKGKLAELGIKPGFIILKINNQMIKTPDDVQKAVDEAMNNGLQDKVLLIAGIYPNGKVTYYAVNLAD